MTNATIEQWRKEAGYHGPLATRHHIEIEDWQRRKRLMAFAHECIRNSGGSVRQEVFRVEQRKGES